MRRISLTVMVNSRNSCGNRTKGRLLRRLVECGYGVEWKWDCEGKELLLTRNECKLTLMTSECLK